jgi:hypothetical protein
MVVGIDGERFHFSAIFLATYRAPRSCPGNNKAILQKVRNPRVTCRSLPSDAGANKHPNYVRFLPFDPQLSEKSGKEGHLWSIQRHLLERCV